ncbi:MAG TPA: hypothetical protein VJM11_08230 [Nevskiaceae bacterium]|nr:hypothetical protein [Nevskiaceae bacterium]
MNTSLNPDLAAELRGADLSVVGALPADAQRQLLEAIRATRKRQQQALDAAIEQGLSMTPALLRGALKRILFP